jgi:hypothetical protein
MLPVPGVATATPGVVFIGAERIVYYTIDYTTNTLGQLRRGTKGTGAASVHKAGSVVVDASVQQLIPGTTFANVTYKPSSNIAMGTAGVVNEGNVNLWYNDGNHVTTATNGTGLDGSTTTAALFLKAAIATTVVGSSIPDALVTEDAINTLTTEDDTDIFEEDQ